MFEEDWMKKFQDAWNTEPGLADALQQINFNSVIAYGFVGDAQPTGVVTVENGHVVSAGAYNGETPNWDLRASSDNWNKWAKKPPGMMGLGVSYTTGKLKFLVGDYGAMVKDPRMAGPFIKSFAVMAKI
ncbi:MAG: SCP-2 sterol transfer family protein [Gammaproteobacteria bacterium]|nr:SCP-2 sterol transfer family protein [Gammaproteobacteria bacterium]MCK5262065.1 SCP-2 sterol transfer family protein [Gammaproteobacteria bacterium]